MTDVLAALRSSGVLEVINAGTTVALAAFAFVQLLQIEEQRRRDLRAAYSALLIEFWRTRTVSERWRVENLLDDAAEGTLRPDEILPVEWGALVPVLGSLGAQTARFAGVAYAHAAWTVANARDLMSFAAERRKVDLEAPPSAEREQLLAEMAEKLEDLAKLVQSRARETADILEDALRSAPRWLQKEKLNLKGLTSAPAEYMRRRLAEREREP